MGDVSIEQRVVLGKRYNFPQLSTKDVEVLETIECWLEFYDKEFVWYCEYKAIWKDDEDPETKVIRDIEKTHCWRYVVDRSTISSLEFVYTNDVKLWMVKVFSAGVDINVQLAFKTKANAEKMYRYICQYKGFEHY